ncbi:MAG: zinc ribbon domain-containing protein [bacterium]|nr:zinc ribbon domain-containing protein [bacterium]
MRFCENCGVRLLAEANFCHKCGAKVTAVSKTAAAVDVTAVTAVLGEQVEPKMQKLYHVHSIVNNFRYKDIPYDNLKIDWFVVGRRHPQVPYEEVITNYATLAPAARVNPENYIMERFTLDEATLLQGFLHSAQDIDAVVDEKELPVGANSKGYRALPPAPGTDFIALYKKKNYDLAFNVEGIFNVKMADERIVPDEQVTVISRIPTATMKKLKEKPG